MDRREKMEKNGSPDAKRIQLGNTVRSKRQEEGQRSGRYDNRNEEKHQNGRSTKKTQGIISYSVEINGEKWKIISIYNKEEKKKTLEELEEIIEGEGWKKMIVKGDFNARTAETGTDRTWEGEEEKGTRRIK